MTIENKAVTDRDFIFTQRDFEKVVQLIGQFAGICLSSRKTDMVYSRLARRLRKLKFSEFKLYLEFVVENSDEQVHFINALTTNLTHFFREEHHFDYLRDEYFPELFSKQQKRIRFWSAGCSTGEEPYSLSMLWNSLDNRPYDIDFKILATDLDTNVLEVCRQGVYHSNKLDPVSEEYLRFFKKTSKCNRDEYQINPKLKEVTYFKQLNLMTDWPMKGPFDLIICRNVLIYFDKTTQKKLVQRFSELLTKGGCLILGHSENLSANKNVFKSLGKTIYRKVN